MLMMMKSEGLIRGFHLLLLRSGEFGIEVPLPMPSLSQKAGKASLYPVYAYLITALQ